VTAFCGSGEEQTMDKVQKHNSFNLSEELICCYWYRDMRNCVKSKQMLKSVNKLRCHVHIKLGNRV